MKQLASRKSYQFRTISQVQPKRGVCVLDNLSVLEKYGSLICRRASAEQKKVVLCCITNLKFVWTGWWTKNLDSTHRSKTSNVVVLDYTHWSRCLHTSTWCDDVLFYIYHLKKKHIFQNSPSKSLIILPNTLIVINLLMSISLITAIENTIWKYVKIIWNGIICFLYSSPCSINHFKYSILLHSEYFIFIFVGLWSYQNHV